MDKPIVRQRSEVIVDIDQLFATYIKLLMDIINEAFPGMFEFHFLDATGLYVYINGVTRDIDIHIYCVCENDIERVYVSLRHRQCFINWPSNICIHDSNDWRGCDDQRTERVRVNEALLKMTSDIMFINDMTDAMLKWKKQHIALVDELSKS